MFGNSKKLNLKVRPHGQKFSCMTWYNMVVRHKTCRGRGSVDGIGDVCCATFYVVRPNRKLSNVGPLQKKFVRHNGLTNILCAM